MSKIRAERIEGNGKSPKERRAALNPPKEVTEGLYTFNKLWSVYVNDRSSYASYSGDRGRYNTYLKEYFGDKEPKNITPVEITHLTRRLETKQSPQSVKHILSLLRRIALYGAKQHLCEPLKTYIQMPTVNNERTENLNKKEMGQLLDAIDEDSNQKVANIMRLGLLTGLRKSEMFGLRWPYVNLEKEFVVIKNPKNGKDTTIPISEGAVRVLRSIKKTEGCDLVFPGKDGKKLRNISPMVNRIKKRAGLSSDFRPLHGLRHCFASSLASAGVPQYTIQKALGHRSAQMTQRYCHLNDKVLRGAVKVASDIVFEKRESRNEVVEGNDKCEKQKDNSTVDPIFQI
ncbi:Tyrosine recombinase XerC [subsurface metagenome]